MKDISKIRKEYEKGTLDESQIKTSPFDQFSLWLDEALKANLPEPLAMTLSTVDIEGKPSSRIVLLRDFDEKGFEFFTNYQSRKGQTLLTNPNACVLFFWAQLERQIRVEGVTRKATAEQADEYFSLRPRESQIAAFASQQSQTLKNRGDLEKNFHDVTERFKDKPVPRPEHWGGYVLEPSYFEFWQGRLHRLHDRICYKKDKDAWIIQRLSP